MMRKSTARETKTKMKMLMSGVVERTLGFLGDPGSIPTCYIWGKGQ
ncbi:hypothetical protein Hanom_Chr05g00394271 [Helianthus anomalus]